MTKDTKAKASNEINIDIELTGFPVKIGAMDIWFDSSMENLRTFFNVDEIAMARLEEAKKTSKGLHFPKVITEENVKDIDEKSLDSAIDINKEYIAIQYDVIFGEGTFKDIYKKYPDILALEKILDPLTYAIAGKITEQEKERSKGIEEKKKAHLKKKQTKKK